MVVAVALMVVAAHVAVVAVVAVAVHVAVVAEAVADSVKLPSITEHFKSLSPLGTLEHPRK